MDNVIAVSGRCAHNLFTPGGIGKLGMAIENTVAELQIDSIYFYIFETCNRGPLLLDRKKLIEMNYLDEENYFLDDSDHDLMARAYLEKRYICGYVPIDFSAPIHLGSTRNTQKYNYRPEYIINTQEKMRLTHKPRIGLSKYKNVWIHRPAYAYLLPTLSDTESPVISPKTI